MPETVEELAAVVMVVVVLLMVVLVLEILWSGGKDKSERHYRFVVYTSLH